MGGLFQHACVPSGAPLIRNTAAAAVGHQSNRCNISPGVMVHIFIRLGCFDVKRTIQILQAGMQSDSKGPINSGESDWWKMFLTLL